MLPMSTTSTPVASVVTTMKISSLTSVDAVLLVEAASSQRHLRSAGHRADQQHAEVGHVVGRDAQRRARAGS